VLAASVARAPVNGARTGNRGTILLEYGGRPVVLDEIVLAAALVERLTKSRLHTYRASMHRFFETHFGVRILKAQEKRDVEACLSPPRALASRCGMPV
jgi:GntR family transcriptional regulator